MIEVQVREVLEEILTVSFPEAAGAGVEIQLEIPRDRSHGDLSTNVAMALAKPLRRSPREIAADLVAQLEKRSELFAAVELAGPGFINFRIASGVLHSGLAEILREGEAWGTSNTGAGEQVQVEFVSANPTGPLNVVSARAAAYGSTLTRLLLAAGYDTRSEFYVNDVGRQIDLFGGSLIARWRELKGEGPAVIPEDGYQGDYVTDLAGRLSVEEVEGALAASEEREQWGAMGRVGVVHMLEQQEADLEAYGTRFDRWFQQSELYPAGVEDAFSRLEERGHVETREGAQWFTSTRFGDDQDRVLIRANGEPTYFLADLAYHIDKHDRGFKRVIDIWGPDHHGYIGRMQAAMEALGYGRDWLEILIVQQVNLLSGGKPAKMSKRLGEFITLADLIEEVGKDSATFFFLMRRAESHLDFDIDLAKQESDENPVYYVKYAHARISGILRKAVEEGFSLDEPADFSLLGEEQELSLIKVLLQFPSLIAGAAREREPHRLTNYLREVSQAFHLFYHHCRVVGPEQELSRARLALTRGTRRVLANGLRLMDIDAPERM